jgi:hypothetical protein
MKSIKELVAKYFLDNPHNFKHVIHIDGDKLNNKVENLKWISNKFLYQTHGKSPKKLPIIVEAYTIDGIYIGTYSSIREASLDLGVAQSNIVAYLKGRIKKVGNYIFKKI